MLVRRLLATALAFAILGSGSPGLAIAADVDSADSPAFAEPSVSPDHREIAFISGGDIWSVPSSGGTAQLLAAVGGYAHRPLFSPDGKRLAFVNTRPSSSGIYVLTLEGGSLRRITHDDQVGDLSAWSNDGRYLYFASATGRLGVDWDAAEYERTGRLRVAYVVPLGPAAVAAHLAPGDELLAVNGTSLARSTDVDELLANTIGKRTDLRIAPRGDAASSRNVAVLPVDRNVEDQLRYRAWVATRRAYVDRLSGGRLGYVHLADMTAVSLDKFYLDLDVQNRDKAGVVVDIRNNTGGFVDPYALDLINRREYLRFKSRFGFDAPERTSLGQRALDLPTALITNEHSLSDAEDFSEGYRELRAGPIVGEPTAGWIIFTRGITLADGSSLRLPTTRVIAHDGVDMELHPRPVDVRVENPPGASERGEDPQLEAAVRELLTRTRGRQVR